MEKTILYKYLGTNGTILSPIHLEDIYYVRKIQLIASPGQVLTNGHTTAKVMIIPEEDIDLWKEIPEEEGQR